MSRLWRLVPSVLALLLAGATVASAGVPLPPDIEFPPAIRLVGSTGGVPDTAGRFTVVVRDWSGVPVADAAVVVDLSATPDLRLCDDMLDPGIVVNCATRTARGTTDATGTVKMTLLGASAAGLPTTATGARMYADGVLFTPLTWRVSVVDLNGSGGATGTDLGVLLGDIGASVYAQRSDLTGDGALSGTDLGRLLTIIGGARSTVSCARVCP